MALTFIGILLLLVGLPITIYGRPEAVLALLLGCSVLGGASAIDLPALGGSSIPPIHFALLFGVVRIFLPGSGQAAPARAAIEHNWPLLLFAAYGAVIGVAGPRIFRGALNLPTLRQKASAYIYSTQPLGPSPQSLTTSVYLIGTLLCAIIAFVVCSRRGGGRTLVRTAVTVAWINVALGIVVTATKGTPLEAIFLLFRNGAYAQLDQQYLGMVRISGLFPEPSAYAAYAFVWFCFLFECWYRDVLPKRTGPIAMAVLAILLLSTSSTAYVSLAGFALVFGLRLLLPGAARSDKLLIILFAAILAAMAASMMFFVLPAVGGAFVEMIQAMTVGKSQSLSGLQRAFWARKGLEAFTVSHGLGVGPGSFRSSSLITAILGSTGVIGIGLFALYLGLALKPLRASTYRATLDERTATGVAAGWAALTALIPYSLTLPTCDPGADFAILCGAAPALRALPAPQRAAPPAAGPAILYRRSIVQ